MTTPKTDAAATDGWSGDAFAVPVEFARAQERTITDLVLTLRLVRVRHALSRVINQEIDAAIKRAQT